ncbi:MAG: Undecaprenyl diphosphate synthase [uncultured bacterium (gcode 4)]|uniref:Undecaprenyl diphosphate synthase n=1 Tax=uncultured bacterium (gcode 4) TaxID=1234023 RepID=K2G2W4_9BACT|nr:MAG: Undecaprenyl diphosphate synthase [uncultured bacterium (gcode 4)]
MHIWFVMDGNRRWATSHKMIKLLGHSKWSDNVENVLKMCLDEWIEYVSMWVIAKKNLEERSKEELEHLFWLIRKRIPEMLPKFLENWVRFETIWNKDLLPDDINQILRETEMATEKQSEIVFILAVWYGWQDEIVRWVKNYIKDNLEAIMNWWYEEIMKWLNEKKLSLYLDTWKYPPPDLIVRTGWDIRTSWYFLFQSEYSEYYFTSTLWPDFDKIELQKALWKYRKAQRNFWK